MAEGPSRSAGRSGRTRTLAGALLAVAVALLLRAPIANVPFERDEGEYAYIAWRWLEGELPYRDTFDQKPPAVFAVYAAIEAIAGTTPATVHWALQLWLCAAQLALFALARASRGTATASAAAIFFALATSSPALLGNAANVEGFALLPLVAGVALARRGATRAAGGRGARRASGAAAAAGGCGAVALLFKPVTAPIVLYSLVLLTLGGAQRPAARRARQALSFAAGGAVCALPVLVAFAAGGGLGAFYDATVRFNAAYASVVPLRVYPVQFWDAFLPSLATLTPLYAAAALGLLAGLAALLRAGDARDLWIWGWLAASFLAVSAGGYFREHYFLYWAPPLALLAAVGCAEAARTLPLPAAAAGLVAPLAALGLLGLGVAGAPWYYGTSTPANLKARRIYGANSFVEAPQLAAFLAQHSGPEETLFVFGSEPELHVYARRRNAGRYILAYHYAIGSLEAVRGRQQEVLASLRLAPPRLVVLALLPTSLLETRDTPYDLRLGLTELLRERYRPIARLVPGYPGPGRLETHGPALAAWRNPALLAQREHFGELVVFARDAAEGG